jgi:CopG family nickel-responsive transcriptional regulator
MEVEAVSAKGLSAYENHHNRIFGVGRTRMKGIERIGISVEQKLLSDFDRLIAGQGYKSRSEAIRDLIRERISREKLGNPKADAVAAVCLVYDHHSTKLMEKLTGLQHSNLLQTICTMHIHLDRHDCMELIVLKGQVGAIDDMAENMISQKGVKQGKVSFVTTSS